MDRTGRTNQMWVSELRSSGAEQQAALADLREALLRGLRSGLSSGKRLDDSFLEDAAQDSLVRILAGLDQFAGRSRVLTWATSIAIRVALSELRRQRWKDVSLEQLTAEGAFRPEETSGELSRPEMQWERKVILDSMQALIEQELTERQRTALLAELRGMPQDEIARHLGSSRNAVYKLTHDARKRLKQGLQAAGFEADDVQAAFSM